MPAVATAMRQAREALDVMVSNKLLTQQEGEAAYNRLHPSIDLEAAATGADIVVESVRELLALKKEIFTRLSAMVVVVTLTELLAPIPIIMLMLPSKKCMSSFRTFAV